jgi:hypothetical protein
MTALVGLVAVFIGLGFAAYGLGYAATWVYGFFKVTAVSLD